MTKDIIKIAGAIKYLYDKIYNKSPVDNDMTEMKMHKLLYFAQKKHYSNFGEWLFEEDFEGWVHGPVNRKVRNYFDFLPKVHPDELTLEEEYTIREIIHEYGKFSAIQLRDISHQENAYKISRRGLTPDERGEEKITKENIIVDIVAEQEAIYQ